jgi:integrase
VIDITLSIWYDDKRAARGNQPWRVAWREPDTKKKRARFFDTEAAAVKFKNDFTRTVATLPTDDTPPTVAATRGTVAAYLADWLEYTVKPHREGATYRSYEQLIRIHVLPTMGDLSLKQDLGFRQMVKFFDDLRKGGVSLPTRRHVKAALSSAFSQAVLTEEIDHNPCANVGKVLRHKDETSLDPEPNPFTPTEARLFLDEVEAVETEWLEYFQFLHDTGVRVGEAAALTWANVDLDGGTAKIVASYSPSDGKDKAPKTHQRRKIDLTTLVVTQLRELRTRQAKHVVRKFGPAYVFTNRFGSPRRQDGNMRRVFDRVLVATNLKGHTPHDLRDTFATTHLTNDYSRLPWVSQQLGHENTRTTVEHYYRFLPTEATKGFADTIREAR